MKRLILLLPLILISAVAHAEWELILDEETYLIASDGERLYAGTARGILYSRDDGDTWRLSDFKQPAVNLTASPDAIYASTWGLGIIRSVTKGNTWHLKNNGFDPRSDYPRVRQFLVTSFGMVIAVSNAGTWISRDRGDRWHSIIDEWEVKDQYGDGFRFGDRIWSMGEFGGYLWLLYLHGLAARSPDDGATWEALPRGRHVRTIEQFGDVRVWLEFRGNLYVATSTRLIRSRSLISTYLTVSDRASRKPHNRCSWNSFLASISRRQLCSSFCSFSGMSILMTVSGVRPPLILAFKCYVFMLIWAWSVPIHSVTLILGALIIHIQETKEVTELMGCRIAYAILRAIGLIVIVPMQVIIENHISFDNLLLGIDYP